MFKRLYPLLFLVLLSMQVKAQTIMPVKLADGSSKEVLVLPDNYQLDSSIEEIASVKNGKGIFRNYGDFKPQLEKVVQKAAAKGGNVFRISRIHDKGQQGIYDLAGDVFSAADYDRLKAKALEIKSKKLEQNKYAFLVIYRPVYSHGHNDEISFKITVNDTLSLEMKANTKYIIKLANEARIKLVAGDTDVMQPLFVDVKRGNTYYVRGFSSYPYLRKRLKKSNERIRVDGYKPYLLPTDELQGELESSTVTWITLKRTL